VLEAEKFEAPSAGIGSSDTQLGSDNPMLAALRAGQEDRLRHAAAYREMVGDPIDILTTLLPMPESAGSLLPDEAGRVEE